MEHDRRVVEAAREIAPLAREIARILLDEHRIDGLWSLKSVAAWFEISERKARDLVNTPGFPRASRLPSDGEGLGHPRWLAAEVIAWWKENRGR